MVSYCTNIHPGETWPEIFANVRAHVPTVKAAVSARQAFPIGLRLSGRAAQELTPGESRRFREWCGAEGCFVTTLNGFPYGRFHGVPLKEGVYRPDWRDPERLAYTRRLAELLAGWLPEGQRGSISTVPVGFRRTLTDGIGAAKAHLRASLEHLHGLAQATGREILLALEPEPGCLLETTPDAVRFAEEMRLPSHLHRHLAVCYDCCHQALQFERPAESLRLLREAGLRIGHVQVSSALRLLSPKLDPLERFCEPWYLHQTVGRRSGGELVRYDDLPEAIAARMPGIEEWRVHFHVPVFVDELADCRTTQPFLREVLPLFEPGTPLEVETYTWSVLPPDLRAGPVTDSLAREIRWVAERLEASAGA
ncbi:MAG: metabolite traffic protein EboE [Deltaproteobacteria bacterium]|nr:metabolite traffic protein EboE [Deltaproteobacteria bacterium]